METEEERKARHAAWQPVADGFRILKGGRGVVIDWHCKGCGFGQLTIGITEKEDHEEFELDTECMGEEFTKKVLVSLADYIIKNGKIL